MKKLPTRFRIKRYLNIGLAVFLASSSYTIAQENESGTDEVFELSPFEVDGSGDEGYLAANSLAGTRLNTSLKDISSVIDVYTREFMDDLGATDLKDVMDYANNLIQDTEDTTHGFSNVQVQAWTSYNFRIRGLSASRARNYFEYRFAFDNYNIERLDESRGPNAILFGFGSPGGIINSSTKRPHFGRKKGTIEYSRGTEVKHRATLDVNQIVVDDVLAIRLNAVHHEEEGWKTYTHDDREAYTASLVYQPFKKTKIFLEYEDYYKHDETARPFNHHNYALAWQQLGTPLLAGGWNLRNNKTYNPDLTSTDIAHMARLSNLNNNNKDGQWTFIEDDSSFLNWRGLVKAKYPNPSNAFLPDGTKVTYWKGARNVAFEPEGILSVNVFGPEGYREVEVENMTAVVQQEIFKNFHIEFAATRNDGFWEVAGQNASHLQGDPNLWLPTASTTDNLPDPDNPELNPFAGMAYMETTYQNRIQDENSEMWRISASYSLDFEEILDESRLGSILGKHNIASLYADSEYEVLEIQNVESLLLDGVVPRPDLPGNSRNKVYRRKYIQEVNDPLEYIIASKPISPINTTLADGTVVTSEFLPFKRRWDFTRTNESKMIALQSYWFGGRLVTTVGQRSDDVLFESYLEKKDTTNGTIVRDTESLDLSEYTGDTQITGAVFHVTQNFSVFANKSDSFGAPTFVRNLVPDGDLAGPTLGEGEDYGLKLSFFDDRVSIVASTFEAVQKNEIQFGGVDNWAQNNQGFILDALIDEGLMTESETTEYRVYGNGHTFDSATEGHEISLVGRITGSWDVRVNYSWTDRELTNIAPNVVKWAEEVGRPFWSSLERDNPNTPEADTILDTVFVGNQTLRERVDDVFEANLALRIFQASRMIGLRRNKASVFTSYNFRDGLLEGLRVGAGVRYQDKPVIGQDLDGEDMFGKSNTSVDILASYRTTIWDRDVTFQVNVRNAFRDEVEWSPISILYEDNIDSIVVFPPREFLFTVRYDF